MTYGITIQGYNEYSCLTSHGKNLVYMGKATRMTGTGTETYPRDFQGQSKLYYTTNHASTDNTSTTGQRKLTCRSETGSCSYSTYDIRLTDDFAYWKYELNATSNPTLFIYTSHDDVQCGILGIKDVGAGTPSGYRKYEILVSVAYPDGWRTTADSYIEIYGFSEMPDYTPTGHGLAIYDENGDLAYHGDKKPAMVKDILSITAISGDWDNVVVTTAFLANPPTAVTAMGKPAFMWKDWATPERDQYNQYTVEGWDSYHGECDGHYTYTAHYSMRYVSSGFGLAADDTLIINIQGTDYDIWTCGNASGLTDTVDWNHAEFPLYVPVIDGADYD